MATIPCVTCQGTGQIGESSCPVCSGSGERDAFATWGVTEAHLIAMLQLVVNINTKLDALDTKLDTIDAHLDVIEAKIDAL